MMLLCIKQHLSNIWSSIHKKVKQHWCWVEKRCCLLKKACIFAENNTNNSQSPKSSQLSFQKVIESRFININMFGYFKKLLQQLRLSKFVFGQSISGLLLLMKEVTSIDSFNSSRWKPTRQIRPDLTPLMRFLQINFHSQNCLETLKKCLIEYIDLSALDKLYMYVSDLLGNLNFTSSRAWLFLTSMLTNASVR